MTQLLTFCLVSFLMHFLLMLFFKELTLKKIFEGLFFSPTTLIIFLYVINVNLFKVKETNLTELQNDCLILSACFWTIILLKTINLI